MGESPDMQMFKSLNNQYTNIYAEFRSFHSSHYRNHSFNIHNKDGHNCQLYQNRYIPTNVHIYQLTIFIQYTSKQVLWQTVKTKMK